MSRKKRKTAARESGPLRFVPLACAVWFGFVILWALRGWESVFWQGVTFLGAPKWAGAERAASLLSLAGGYAVDLIVLYAVAAAANGYGRLLTSAFLRTPLSIIERIVLNQGLGLGVLSLLLLAGGFHKGAFPGMAVFVPAVGIALSAIFVTRDLRWGPQGISPEAPGFFRSLSGLEWTLLGIIAYSMILHLVGAFGPETHYDALVYHLAAPKDYLLRGRIEAVEGILHTNFPQNMGMLYLIGLVLRGENLAKLLHLHMFGLTLLAMYGLGRTACSRRTALTACALLTAVPVAAHASWHTGVELGLAFWQLMGVWALIRGFYALQPETDGPSKIECAGRRPQGTRPKAARWTGQLRWFAVSGAFYGLAMGSKYTALWAALAAAAVLVIWLAGRGDLPFRVRAGIAGAWGAAAALVLSPWLVKNALLAGNPVYPFLGSVFGSPSGPYPDVSGFAGTVRGHFWYGGLLEWRTWLVMPWRIFAEGRSPFSFMGPLLVALAPLILLVRRAVFPFGWLILLFGLQYLAWSSSSSLSRYLVPALPLFCLYAAHQLHRLERSWKTWVPWAAVVLSVWNLAWNASMLNEKEVPAVVFGYESRDSYLGRTHHGYPAACYETARAADSLPREAVVLVIGEARGYHVPRRVVISTQYDRSALVEALSRASSAADLRGALERLGVTHLLINHPETHRLLGDRLEGLSKERLRTLSRFWRGHLKELRSAGPGALYELTAPKEPIPPATSAADLPEIIRIAVDRRPGFKDLPAPERVAFLKFVAD